MLGFRTDLGRHFGRSEALYQSLPGCTFATAGWSGNSRRHRGREDCAQTAQGGVMGRLKLGESRSWSVVLSLILMGAVSACSISDSTG